MWGGTPEVEAVRKTSRQGVRQLVIAGSCKGHLHQDGWEGLCGTSVRGQGSRLSKNCFAGAIRRWWLETGIWVCRELCLCKTTRCWNCVLHALSSLTLSYLVVPLPYLPGKKYTLADTVFIKVGEEYGRWVHTKVVVATCAVHVIFEF